MFTKTNRHCIICNVISLFLEKRRIWKMKPFLSIYFSVFSSFLQVNFYQRHYRPSLTHDFYRTLPLLTQRQVLSKTYILPYWFHLYRLVITETLFFTWSVVGPFFLWYLRSLIHAHTNTHTHSYMYIHIYSFIYVFYSQFFACRNLNKRQLFFAVLFVIYLCGVECHLRKRNLS